MTEITAMRAQPAQPAFEEAVRDAVRGWTFTKALDAECKPIPAQSRLQVRFDVDWSCRAHRRGQHFAQATAQPVQRLRCAGIERIEYELTCAQPQLHHEMPGKRDALQRKAQQLAEMTVKNGQGDRYPGASIDDLVQIAVARIEVVVGVAVKSELAEEVRIERAQLLLGEGVDGKPRTNRRRHCVELTDRRFDIERRIGVLRDHQAGLGNVEARLRHQPCETV